MAQRNGRTCILFRESPDWVGFREGQYTWMPSGEAQNYILGGFAIEYNPYEGRPEKPTMDNTKAEIIDYLEDNDLEYTKSSTKSELLDVVYEEPDQAEEPEPIPEDFPARHHFIEIRINDFNKVKQMAEEDKLMSVPGIGQSTEHKIKKYLGE